MTYISSKNGGKLMYESSFDVGLDGEQLEAFTAIIQHATSPFKRDGSLIIGGIGGSGKTFTIRRGIEFLSSQNIRGYMGAYTGRASSQLRKSGLDAKTLHSLLYKAVLDDKGDLLFFDKRPLDEILESAGSFLCIDEGSMVPKGMVDTLLSLHVPLIMSGDFFQLPSVDPENGEYNAMTDMAGERISLTQNRRIDPDAEGIFRITEHLREHNTLPRMGGKGYKAISKAKILNVPYHENNQYDVILVGTNKTRKKLNNLVRNGRGFTSKVPDIGERVICLQNTVLNEVPLSNGEIFEVKGVIQGNTMSTFYLENVDNGDTVAVNIYNETWETEKIPSNHNKKTNGNVGCFGYAYAISVHKSQGSTFENVLFYDEDVSFFLNQQRFRYTACSRASKNLVVSI
jgi:exodeoxyribonuclease-5